MIKIKKVPLNWLCSAGVLLGYLLLHVIYFILSKNKGSNDLPTTADLIAVWVVYYGSLAAALVSLFYLIEKFTLKNVVCFICALVPWIILFLALTF